MADSFAIPILPLKSFWRDSAGSGYAVEDAVGRSVTEDLKVIVFTAAP
jgi:hypothetical protein